MLNITVIGRVAKEPDIRKDANGTPYAIVEVTTHRTYKSADGTHITDTVPVKLYDKQVELFQRFAFPGSRIAIIGNFEPSPFENSDSEYARSLDTGISTQNTSWPWKRRFERPFWIMASPPSGAAVMEPLIPVLPGR